MLTRTEQEFYEALPHHIGELAEEVSKLRIAVEKCIGHKVNAEDEPTKEKNDSPFDCLAVTNVQVFPFNDGASLGHTEGIATVVLNDQLRIRGLRIMDGENGLFVSFPSDPFYEGEDFRCLVFPITRQLREHIENCVLEKYQHMTE